MNSLRLRSKRTWPPVYVIRVGMLLWTGLFSGGMFRLAAAVDAPGEARIAYEGLRGARRVNPDTGFWEVGWRPPQAKRQKTWIYPVEGLEGVYYRKFKVSPTFASCVVSHW